MHLFIANVEGKGRGVFTNKLYVAGAKIDEVQLLIFPAKDTELVEQTELTQYYYTWRGGGAIALGYGSLVNHSSKPNVRFEKNYDQQTISFYAVVDIPPETELTIDYRLDDSPLWFIPKD